MNVHILARKLRSVFQVLRYPRFAGIKFRAFGMLSPKVYARIYEATMRGPDLDVLEIGAARGAATIVIAKALLSSEKRAKVVAVEKFSGGSNVDFGGKDENLVRIRALFDFYGVTDKVTIFAHYLTGANVEEVKALISTEQIGLLLIDADGRLDVHLPLVWSRLSSDCPIILDDYRENYDFAVRSERFPLGRTKELTCFRLVNRLRDLGYLKIESIVSNTVFARKARSGSFSESDRTALREEVSSVEREYEAWLERQRS